MPVVRVGVSNELSSRSFNSPVPGGINSLTVFGFNVNYVIMLSLILADNRIFVLFGTAVDNDYLKLIGNCLMLQIIQTASEELLRVVS
ncbi:hypothetical protein ES703_87954 [subsurface metagenome]